MARDMTPEGITAFPSERTRTGKIATVRQDGSPNVVPIWFVLDGDDLVFTTGDDSAKADAIERDPRMTITVDLEEPPYACRGRLSRRR
jgi:nitroimidazol reductase NimA-like FMN-containing flavoprotein (pyridoxamine 5'-phosphate oxidase superfamily)